MISDVLADAEKAIHDHQTSSPMYDKLRPEIDALRCQIVVLQMKLDNMLPDEWLERNPIYTAAKAGNIGPHDAFMHDLDDSVLADYRREFAAAVASARGNLP